MRCIGKEIANLDQVSTLPLEYRGNLAEQGWQVGLPLIARQFISSDGTVRYLIELADGETVETVWMPEGDGGESGDGSDAGDEVEPDASSVGGGARPRQRESFNLSDDRIRLMRHCTQAFQLQPRHHLRVQPSGLRGELQILLHGIARGKAKPRGWRDHRADCGRAARSASRSRHCSASTSSSWAWANRSSTTRIS